MFGGLIEMGPYAPQQAAEVVIGRFDGVEGRHAWHGHIWNGNFKGCPLLAVVRNAPWVAMLQELDGVVDVAALECGASTSPSGRSATRSSEMPQNMQLAAGIVDEASDGIETVEEGPRPRRRLGARAGRGAVVDLALVGRLRAPPGRTRPVLREKLEHMMEAASSF